MLPENALPVAGVQTLCIWSISPMYHVIFFASFFSHGLAIQWAPSCPCFLTTLKTINALLALSPLLDPYPQGPTILQAFSHHPLLPTLEDSSRSRWASYSPLREGWHHQHPSTLLTPIPWEAGHTLSSFLPPSLTAVVQHLMWLQNDSCYSPAGWHRVTLPSSPGCHLQGNT